MKSPAGLGDHVFNDLQRSAAVLDPRTAEEKIARFLKGLSAPQLGLVMDRSPQIAVNTARRTGKTFALLRRWARMCQHRGIRPRKFMYAALSRMSAKQIIWDSLLDLDNEFQLSCKFNHTELTMRWPGGHQIALGGADDQADIEKYRGQGFDEFAIDECQSFPPTLFKRFVEQVVGPTLLDRKGTLLLLGTPGPILSGPFYEATRPDAKASRPYSERGAAEWRDRPWEWSFHTWTLQDNTGVPDIWLTALDKKRRNGWTDENPVWQREYLGRWVADLTGFVYLFNVDRNVRAPEKRSESNPFGLPTGHVWSYVYGMDMGWKDPFALQVGAYSPTHPILYRVYEFSRTEMMIDEIGNLLNSLVEKTGYPDAMVADDSHMGGAIIAEINERFGLAIEKAEKKSKNDHVTMMNSDLVDGKFIILRDKANGELPGGLEREMLALQWDETGLKENKAQPNHNCDAAIYMRRKAAHHFSEEAPAPGPVRGSQEDLAARSEAKAEEDYLRRREGGEPDDFVVEEVDDGW